MRKLTMLAVSALAALAFAGLTATTATASDPFTLYTHEAEPCPAVSLNDGEVTGGCLTEDFDGSFDLGAFIPNWYLIGRYDSTFDLVVDANGTGYAANPTVEVTTPSLAREACDEPDGTVLPWPVQARAVGSQFELDITLGVRSAGSGPGGACTQQQITVQMTGRQSGWQAELDQGTQSANVANANWIAPSLGMWVIIG
jgi:hypothetical protein